MLITNDPERDTLARVVVGKQSCTGGTVADMLPEISFSLRRGEHRLLDLYYLGIREDIPNGDTTQGRARLLKPNLRVAVFGLEPGGSVFSKQTVYSDLLSADHTVLFERVDEGDPGKFIVLSPKWGERGRYISRLCFETAAQ